MQNWQGSGNPLDSYVVKMGVVPGNDGGNLSASSSDTSPGLGEQFDVTVNWDFGMNGPNGHYIGVMDFGTQPGNEGDLGAITIDFISDRVSESGFE